MRPTIVEIDLAALRHNVAQLKETIGPNVKLMAVVKANAYGHGAIKVSKAALSAGADYLAVALPEEGAELRSAGIAAPITILGLTLPDEAEAIIEQRLTATVATIECINTLAAAARARGTKAKLVLKVDTGMGRIGITPAEIGRYLDHIASTPGTELAGVFTHLASADAADKTYATEQLKSFNKALSSVPGGLMVSAGNSATIIDLPNGHYNTVRPGIAMYGLPPSGEMHKSLDLKPAMSLKTKVVYIKHVPAGMSVSYGCTYTTGRETYLATLPVGYADGYSRLLSSKASVLIGGKRRPVVGRVCMDQIIVDLGPELDAAIGDEAVLFGKQGNAEITVTELAGLIGTINYELVCAVSGRVPRLYLNE